MIIALGAGDAAGPLGLLVVILVGVVTVLLIRNMNARLRRLPTSFDPELDDDGDEIGPDDLAG